MYCQSKSDKANRKLTVETYSFVLWAHHLLIMSLGTMMFLSEPKSVRCSMHLAIPEQPNTENDIRILELKMVFVWIIAHLKNDHF